MVTLQLYTAPGTDTAAILYRADSIVVFAQQHGWVRASDPTATAGPLLLVGDSDAPPASVIIIGPRGPVEVALRAGEALLIPAGATCRRPAALVALSPVDRAAPVDPLFGGLYPLRAARRLGDELRIVYLDQSIVVIDKPAGQVVHPHQVEWQLPAAREALAGYVRGKLWTVHRLDRATSGLLLLARTATAAAELSRQFRERAVRKEYLAVLRGHLREPRVVDTPLKREHNRTVADPAETWIEPIAHGVVDEPVGKYPQGWYTLARVQIATGRYHQIRRHASSISHPVLGDRQHGDGVQNRFLSAHLGTDALLLRAHMLQFAHPVHGGTLRFRAATPPHWRHAIGALGLAAPDYLHEDTLIEGISDAHRLVSV